MPAPADNEYRSGSARGALIEDRRTALADVRRIMAALAPLPAPRPRPALVVLSGLPGSGKSYFQRRLRDRTGAVVLESDALRRLLFGCPTYTREENARLFRAIHSVADRLLRSGRSVIIDATNLTEWERQPYYKMADQHGARLLIVQLTAPDAVIRERLERRAAGVGGPDQSQADTQVYERMRGDWEEISHAHYTVDTASDITAAVAAVAEAMEAGAP